MDHQEAARIQAPERYLLGELTAPEREAFEEHYLLCTECADEVRMADLFADAACEAFRDQARSASMSPAARPQTGSSWWGWPLDWARGWRQMVPTLAAVLLLCVAGYDQLVIRHDRSVIRDDQSMIRELTAPRGLYGVLARTGTKGADNPTMVPPDQRFFEVIFDFPREHDEYICNIESNSGKLITSVTIKRLRTSPRFSILLKRSDFPDGEYILKLRLPGSQTPESTYYFQVAAHPVAEH